MNRLMERENALVLRTSGQGKTYSKVKAAYRQEMLLNNHAKFSNNSIGVHGKELPKFSDTSLKFWEFGNYNKKPKF